MMKKQALFISLLLAQSIAVANQQQVQAPNTYSYSINGVYAYNDFKFDSTTAGGFNRYKGHANFYSIGGNNVRLNNYFSAGLSAYWINTSVHSKLLLPGFSFSSTDQSITNNSLYGHILTQLNPSFFFDVAGGYGQNTQRFHTTVQFSEQVAHFATANNRGNNWFISGAALYGKQLNKFSFNANVGILHTEVNQRPYYLNFVDYIATQFVDRFRTNVTFVLENAELGYQMTPAFKPFVNGGLLQVANFDNNQRLVPVDFVGPFPGINLDKNGYKVGGGVDLTYKLYSLRVEQQYFKRGGIYSSNQTTVTLTANFA